MADTIVITKLSNGSVSVNNNGNEYTLNPNYTLHKEVAAVEVLGQAGVRKDQFLFVEVEKLVYSDGTEVTISTVDGLYSGLLDFFDARIDSTQSVIDGNRPSQKTGRTHVQVPINISADTLMYTVSAGKTLYITDMFLSLTNTTGGTEGKLIIEDSLAVGGTPVLPINIYMGGIGNSSSLIVPVNLKEPLVLSSGVFFNELTGTLLISGVFTGYEE
jgi:hypothetical protein